MHRLFVSMDPDLIWLETDGRVIRIPILIPDSVDRAVANVFSPVASVIQKGDKKLGELSSVA